MSSSESEPGALERQAQAWWVRLHSGGATRADADAFRQWATHSAAHAQAWRDLMRTWSALDPLLAKEAVGQAPRARAFPWSGVSCTSWSGLSAALHSPGRRAFLGGAVAASVAAGAMVVDPPLGLWPSVGDLMADYRTATGEQRQVALGQDVRVNMNTQTRVNRIGGGERPRGMALLAGEAEVAASGTSDFFVETGGGRLLARAARFNIRHTGPQVCVTCLDGRVTVSVNGEQRSLEAGRQVSYDTAGLREVVRVDLASVDRWRTGLLSFDRMPLSEVVEEINRYRPGKVLLRNEELGRTLVTMQLNLRSVDNALLMIRELYGARMRSFPGGIVMLG
ncbi:FecR domain-containing protein [Variovorax sp. KBW07]|uniref:FecR family protein n=1 Tax=Variovorax sp. KBW07 TaxID=2153358 RepID=UPI001625122A|nr:FecR domain-containing protein [Variovorax sp. KBW07]